MLTIVAAALLLPLAAGCTPTAPEPTPSATVAESASPSPTPSPTATAPELVFTQPTTCSELAGPDLEAVFASRNIELFNSSNGEGMFADGPVDTHQQGGNPFGCLWGVPYVDLNTFVLSSQPLSQAAHELDHRLGGSRRRDLPCANDRISGCRRRPPLQLTSKRDKPKARCPC